MIDKYQQMEDFKQLEVETVNLPCKKCNGDCCGPDVHFTKEEIEVINNKISLKKLVQHVNLLIQIFPNYLV